MYTYHNNSLKDLIIQLSNYIISYITEKGKYFAHSGMQKCKAPDYRNKAVWRMEIPFIYLMVEKAVP